MGHNDPTPFVYVGKLSVSMWTVYPVGENYQNGYFFTTIGQNYQTFDVHILVVLGHPRVNVR